MYSPKLHIAPLTLFDFSFFDLLNWSCVGMCTLMLHYSKLSLKVISIYSVGLFHVKHTPHVPKSRV